MKEAVVDLQNIIGPLKQNATPVAIIFPWSLSSAIIHHDFVVMLDDPIDAFISQELSINMIIQAVEVRLATFSMY